MACDLSGVTSNPVTVIIPGLKLVWFLKKSAERPCKIEDSRLILRWLSCITIKVYAPLTQHYRILFHLPH